MWFVAAVAFVGMALLEMVLEGVFEFVFRALVGLVARVVGIKKKRWWWLE